MLIRGYEEPYNRKSGNKESKWKVKGGTGIKA